MVALLAVAGVQAQSLKELQAQQKKYAEEIENTGKMIKQTKQNEKATENKRLIRTEFRDWRKLNLVLQSLDENYVDTIDRKAVTDAAITAALGALDPHSVYMPPAILEESETELAGNFDGIGIQFNVPNDTAIVLEVIPGG
ncbi:S41 family peptidase, partial [uncultured Ruminococcus sp.]|uniref:S41 family peptidase n=1 Tax=uncultured Ruminococcus sp. TaxID=165186 RepID=UPI0037DD925E